MKRILTRESYLRELNLKYYNKYTGVEPINEEAPFANDAPWGDTLVGRLINSFARKGKIAFNKRRISGLVSRFKSIFDEMLETGNVDISEEDIKFLKTSNLLGELERQVREEEDVDVLISTTTDLIDLVTSYKFEFQEEMLKALNDFLEYLKGLKKTESDDESTDTDTDTDTENPSEIFYKQSKLFLQSVLDLHMMIKQNVVRFNSGTQSSNDNVGTNFDISKFNEIKSKYEKAQQKDKLALLKQLVQMCNTGLNTFKVKKDTANINLFTKYLNDYSRLLKKLSIQVGKEYIYTNKSGEKKKVKVISVTHDTEVGKDKIWLTQDDIKKATLAKDTISVIYQDKNGKYTSGSPEIAVNFDGLSTVKESLLLEGEANITQVETHSKNAWKKVVNAYNQSKVSSFVPQIEELLKTSIKDGKDKFLQSKKDIIAICKQSVLNKSTVGKPISFDDLIKEAVNINDVSKSISLFGRVLLSYKEDMGLTGGYGSAISPLKSFINSFTELEKTLPKIKSESNKEEVKESISKYDSFILLREKKYSSQITEKFDEVFSEDIQNYFTINEEKVSDFNGRVKKRESMVFTDADPIIEIVRLFNRAWRIHTPGVIPSGRTGGKVSNSVFREYEDLGDRGGTPDQPGSGPYRNIELYEAWFEAVQDILSDTKYRPIFSEDVVFQFKNIETGEDGDSIPKAGKILLKFVNELLSDTKMYKAGAMNKFIQEYFNLDSKVSTTLTGFSNDNKDNDKTSSEIKTTEVVFKKLEQVRSLDFAGNNLWKIFIERKDDFKNLAFRLKVKNGDTTSSYYCVYKQTAENYPIIIFRSDAFPFDITKVSSRDITRNINRSIKTNLASLPKSGGILKKGNNSLFRYVDLSDPGESKVNNSSGNNRVEFEVQEIEILCIKESGEPYLDLDNYLSILKTDITSGYNTALNTVKKY
jgi:hypothetical protein